MKALIFLVACALSSSAFAKGGHMDVSKSRRAEVFSVQKKPAKRKSPPPRPTPLSVHKKARR